MREKGKIAASIMCSGFDQVMDYVHEFERNNIEFLHVDVMDGTFVPNLAYGPDFVKRLRKKTDITLDCHLMVDRAEDKLDWFDFQPGEHVSLHYEGTCHIQKCLDHLAKKGVKPVIAINPGTPIQVLEEIVDYIAGVLVLHVNPGFAGQKIVPHTIEKQHVFVNIWMIWDIRRYILNPTETLPVRMRQNYTRMVRTFL